MSFRFRCVLVPQSGKPTAERELVRPLHMKSKGVIRNTTIWKRWPVMMVSFGAMKYAILDTDWTTPLYIEEGLQWLATPASSTTSSGEAAVVPTTEAAEENADD